MKNPFSKNEKSARQNWKIRSVKILSVNLKNQLKKVKNTHGKNERYAL
jgi:hypothetical protein